MRICFLDYFRNIEMLMGKCHVTIVPSGRLYKLISSFRKFSIYRGMFCVHKIWKECLMKCLHHSWWYWGQTPGTKSTVKAFATRVEEPGLILDRVTSKTIHRNVSLGVQHWVNTHRLSDLYKHNAYLLLVSRFQWSSTRQRRRGNMFITRPHTSGANSS